MTCPLLIELCAGTAAVSLRLHRDGARPPVSRMGAKTGFASTILRVLGLIPGQGAAAYLWCEPDPGVRLLLEAYRDADLARAAAEVIRGWAAEDPRALWERLRAEGPPQGPPADPREVARWLYVGSNSIYSLGTTYAPEKNGLPGNRWPVHVGCAVPLEDVPTLPAAIADDARVIDPGPDLPAGTVAYMDPPYLNTTGYAADLPRAEVVALARRWAAAGATVAISEAEPIPELVAEGWYQVRIDGERVGQKRTFSKQQAEWLTMNRPPAWRPSVQGALFGGV